MNLNRLATLDLETTGTDPREARIVTAYLGIIVNGEVVEHLDLLSDPGIEIPEGAAAVHGITTEHAREHGDDAAANIITILNALSVYCHNTPATDAIADDSPTKPLPLVIYNASYDLTVLLHEARRHFSAEGLAAGRTRNPIAYPAPDSPNYEAYAALPERTEALLDSIRVIDPLVLDKHLDPYRKGSRKLIDTARHYGITLSEEDAHGASADAIAAAHVARAIVERYPQIARLSLALLHEQQADWKAAQATSFQTWLRTKAPADRRDPAAVIDTAWPIQK